MSNIDFSQSSSEFKQIKEGKWSYEENQMFERLLQQYGKNWKKIHQGIPNRTLVQIRSHGQKYFGKHKDKKVKYQRKAILLEAVKAYGDAKIFEQMGFLKIKKQDMATDDSQKSKKSGNTHQENKETVQDVQLQNQSKSHQNKVKTQATDGAQLKLFPFLEAQPKMLQKMQYKLFPEALKNATTQADLKIKIPEFSTIFYTKK